MHPFYPKLVQFGRDYDFEGLVWESYNIDRRLLQRITRADAQQIGERVRKSIDNTAIEKAIAALPPEWRARTSDVAKLRSRLRARRDLIPEVSSDFYDWLATEVDVHATDEKDRAEIERLNDGRVTVTIHGRGDSRSATPFFNRTFEPAETREVRVFMTSHTLAGGASISTVIS